MLIVFKFIIVFVLKISNQNRFNEPTKTPYLDDDLMTIVKSGKPSMARKNRVNLNDGTIFSSVPHLARNTKYE